MTVRKFYAEQYVTPSPSPALIEKTRRQMLAASSPRIPRIPKRAFHTLVFSSIFLFLVLSGVLISLPRLSRPTPPDSNSPQHEALPEAILQGEDKIIVNDLNADPFTADRTLFPPDGYDETWNFEKVSEYLGRDVRPTELPEDLLESDAPETRLFHLYFTEDGELFYDTFHFTYSESFDTDYDPLRRSLNVAVSKVGMLKDCLYMDPDNMQSSMIGGVPVMVGHRDMSYGPYDKDTHEPKGYYDFYLAEFFLDGIEFEVTADNLTEREFLDAVSSLIK